MKFCNQRVPDVNDFYECLKPAFKIVGVMRYCKGCYANALINALEEYNKSKAEYERSLKIYLQLLQAKEEPKP
jgi:hypothetical protein